MVYGCVYRTKSGQIVQRESGIAKLDSNRKLLAASGRIKNITSWVHPKQTPGWYVLGDNEKELYAEVNRLDPIDKLLTNREVEILHLISQGKWSSRISKDKCVLRHTFDTHRRNILRKLGVEGSIEAIKKAEDPGILK